VGSSLQHLNNFWTLAAQPAAAAPFLCGSGGVEQFIN